MLLQRVLSGMRPTGALHLGHYHGVLKNWIHLQQEYESLFFVADWHALTTHYMDSSSIEKNSREMVIDWLAAGIDPNQSVMFVQSHVKEHAELHLLLSMMVPLGWLERVPTYKDQQDRLADRDLSTYGFLGYPLLQAADILIYRAKYVPVGEDQVPHVELTREIARRFNHLYGREKDFESNALVAIKKMGQKRAKVYNDLRDRWQEQGDDEALAAARVLVLEQQSLSMGDRDRLLGYLDGTGIDILAEPDALLTEVSKMPGLDGQKMSKSYHNTIGLREDPDTTSRKIRTMPTDPARVRRMDSGDPNKCPVFQLHRVYSGDDVQCWVSEGCVSAGIGCLDCKQPVIDAILKEQAVMRDRALPYVEDPQLVRNILADGSERASRLAQDTMRDVREAVGLSYSR